MRGGGWEGGGEVGWLVGVVERWMSSGCIEGEGGLRRAGFWMGSSAPR